MRHGHRRNHKKIDQKRTMIFCGICVIALAILAGGGFLLYRLLKQPALPEPEETFTAYLENLRKGNYEGIYDLLDADSKLAVSKEDLVTRYENIYDGIEAVNIQAVIDREPTEEELKNRKKKLPSVLNYTISMDTLAGTLSFVSSSIFTYSEEDSAYRMTWNQGEIFPGLEPDLKVRVKTVYGERGNLYDAGRNLLAGKGEAWSVGIVPGKLAEPRAESLEKISGILDLSVEKIEKALSAKWVKDDLFVPLRTISKNNTELKEQLLEIPGILLNTTAARVYPYGPALGHLTGYVQNITAEELEKKKGENYNAQSVLGKAGMEYALEDTLRSRDGYTILLTDQDGNEVSEIMSSPMQNGEDAVLTIDGALQSELYRQLDGEKGLAVAMNPATGAILALVSTPAFDSNDFAFGFTTNAWNAVNEDPAQPLYNRVKGTWCPGSSLKPIIAALGIEKNTLDPQADIKNEGLSWQKDAGWGDYRVTTLHDYPVKNLQNALVYSDNIYFAKAALALGADNLTAGLDSLGFGEELPFQLNYSPSSYGKDKKITDEIQLADSGYGQGKMLVNPLHLACMYSAFYNGGSMVKPTLISEEEPSFWKEGVFSKETADLILEDMRQVISNPEGTGHGALLEGITVAGKTGTAEIKASKEDTTGTELGWFVAMTPEETEKPLLIVMMAEDVKDRGGSHVVVTKVRDAMKAYYQGSEKLE